MRLSYLSAAIRYSRYGIIFLLIGWLTACGFAKPVQLAERNKYELTAVSEIGAVSGSSPDVLLISLPTAIPAYQGTQMRYVQQPYRLQSFAHNQWVVSPARMLAPLMAESLRNARYFRAVVVPPYLGASDLVLETQLIKLQQEFISQPSVVRLEMSANLVDNRTAQVIASRQFTVVVPAPEDSPQGGVIAANQATQEVLDQLVDFVISAV